MSMMLLLQMIHHPQPEPFLVKRSSSNLLTAFGPHDVISSTLLEPSSGQKTDLQSTCTLSKWPSELSVTCHFNPFPLPYWPVHLSFLQCLWEAQLKLEEQHFTFYNPIVWTLNFLISANLHLICCLPPPSPIPQIQSSYFAPFPTPILQPPFLSLSPGSIYWLLLTHLTLPIHPSPSHTVLILSAPDLCLNGSYYTLPTDQIPPPLVALCSCLSPS